MAASEAVVSIGDQFGRFWRWWTGQLRGCVPSFIVRWLGRIRVLPLVMPEGNGFAVYRFDGTAWRRAATASGDSPEALAKSLGAELRKARIERFTLGLLPGQFLVRALRLPSIAEENLRNALGYELESHTPFKPEDVGYDCCVVERDESNREIGVKLVIAPKAVIAQALAGVAASGIAVAAVQHGLSDRAMLGIDLLPHDESGSGYLVQIKRWAPWVILALLGLAALALPIYQKRAQVIELQPQVNLAAQQAQAADLLRQQLDRTQAEYNFVLQKRYATPTSLQLLAEVTRILPDDTWLQSFELRTTSKGRELQLQGETGVAGKMIELFEQSPLLTGATFKSPVTQAPGSQASRFHVGMDVREAAPPPPRALAQAAEPAASPPAPGATAPPAAGAAAPPAPAATSAGASPPVPASAPAAQTPAGARPAPAAPAAPAPAGKAGPGVTK